MICHIDIPAWTRLEVVDGYFYSGKKTLFFSWSMMINVMESNIRVNIGFAISIFLYELRLELSLINFIRDMRPCHDFFFDIDNDLRNNNVFLID